MIPDFPIDIRIRLAELKFSFVGLLSFAKTANRAENSQSQEATKVNFNSANFSLMSIGKSGTYHQIWIPNNLGFMVLILMYIAILVLHAHMRVCTSHY